MDPWKESSVWEFGRNDARKWAVLEGKSAAMSDDLERKLASRPLPQRRLWRALDLSAHACVWLFEMWRYFRSG